MNIFKKSCIFCLSIVFICFSWSIPVEGAVLSNKKLTISVGNEQSWTGRNGTGNLSYYGCDQKCNCIYLTGGKITCRDGVCRSSWQNKNSSYVLTSPITQTNDYSNTASTLTIFSESKVVLSAELYPKPFDNINGQKFSP